MAQEERSILSGTKGEGVGRQRGDSRLDAGVDSKIPNLVPHISNSHYVGIKMMSGIRQSVVASFLIVQMQKC